MSADSDSDSLTDDQIRQLYREDRSLLDALMVAIHSTDKTFRDSYRAEFARLWRQKSRTP